MPGPASSRAPMVISRPPRRRSAGGVVADGAGAGRSPPQRRRTPERTQRPTVSRARPSRPSEATPRRRRSGKRPDQPAEQTPKKAKPKTLEEQIAAGGPTRGIRTTRTRTPRDGRRRREQMVPPPRITDKLMVITENGDRDQIAVLEEDVLVQHYVTRAGATSMVGNVYLGRVQNVLPGMEAAFVDVGRGR